MQPTLVVHGGAWSIPDDAVEAHRHGVSKALDAGYALLERGGSAIDAVETAVVVLEDDETFDAGRGSFLTRDGRVQLDALLMDGGSTGQLKAGGVACVERLRNPIRAARLVLEQSNHVYFVAQGAEQFAAAHGMALIDNAELVIAREVARLEQAHADAAAGKPDLTFAGSNPVCSSQDTGSVNLHDTGSVNSHEAGSVNSHEAGSVNSHEAGSMESHDTVGAVALDARGNLAAATSTGGTLNKAPGRVGDSSLIGCGCYADNRAAAVSITGWGEPIMKLVLGKWATDRVEQGRSPEQAAPDAIQYLHARLGGHGGMILLGPDGRFGLAHNTPRMAWGLRNAKTRQVGICIE